MVPAIPFLLNLTLHAQNPSPPPTTRVFLVTQLGPVPRDTIRDVRDALVTHRFGHVVPQDEVTATLRTLQKQSHRPCNDDSCHIELGKELAADTVLQVEVRGESLTVRAFDVRTNTQVAASTGCLDDPSGTVKAALAPDPIPIRTCSTRRAPPRPAQPPPPKLAIGLPPDIQAMKLPIGVADDPHSRAPRPKPWLLEPKWVRIVDDKGMEHLINCQDGWDGDLLGHAEYDNLCISTEQWQEHLRYLRTLPECRPGGQFYEAQKRGDRSSCGVSGGPCAWCYEDSTSPDYSGP